MSKIKHVFFLEINNKNDLLKFNANMVVGYTNYSAFAGLILSLDELKEIKNKEKIFIILNALIHQKDLENFKKEITPLVDLGFNFIIQDLGALSYIYSIKKKETKIIYQGYTLISNDDDFKALKDIFDIDIFLNHELNKDELINFKNKENALITIYGYTPIYQSYRKIIDLFEEYRDIKASDNKPIFLKEDTRDDMFPVIRNQYGTFIFRSKPLNRLDYLNELKDYKNLYITFLFLNEEEKERIWELIKDE